MADASQGLESLLQASQPKKIIFPSTSRYFGVDTAIMHGMDGRPVIYLRRRFIPSPDNFALLQVHRVTEGERLDNITAQYFSDPEQFWRVCDANGAMRPDELVETMGREIRITLPEGIPGTPHA